MLLMLGNQVMYQKFFSAKSERDASISVVGWILGTLLLETLIVAIAVFGSALYPTGEVARQPYEIIPYTARHGLPAFMGALLLGAVFAKVISTASNYLFSPASNLVEDVFVRYIAPGASNKRVLIVSRLAVVLLGCWALYQAIYAPSILEKMLYAYTIYSAAVTPVVLAAFYSKRATAVGRGSRHRLRNRRHSRLGRTGFQAISSPSRAPRRTRCHLSRALRRSRRAGRRQRRHAPADSRAVGEICGVTLARVISGSPTTRPEPRIAHSRCSLIGLAIILPELLLPISRILTQPRRFE
jgi:hypothetical protein